MTKDRQPDSTDTAKTDDLSSVSSLASAPSLREEATGRHRVNSRLMAVAVWLLIAVVALGGSLILYVTSTQTGFPRTEEQRELVIAQSNLDANPDNADAWSRLARAQAAVGQTDEALATVRQGIESTGEKLMTLTEADILRFARRQTEAISSYNLAEKYYEQLVADGTVSADEPSEYLAQVTYGRGLCEVAIGDDEAALADFEASVRYFPSSADAWVALGDVYATMGSNKSAISAYNEALRYVPDHPGALQGLVRTGGERDAGE